MKNIENLDKLLVDAKKGDDTAKEEIYSHFKPLVFKIANSYFLIGGNADDLIQEGMIGLFEAIDSFDGDKGNFYAFCGMCIRRNILSALTKSNREKNTPLIKAVNIDDNCDLSDPKADPLSYLVKKDLLEKLHEYINEKLTDSEQNVLKLYMKGYSYVEISAMTGKTKKAVDTALQRARKKLAFFKEN